MSVRGVVFFARHGETDWNAAGRWQGQTDIPLNDVGRAQARALAVRLRGEGIVALGSSDLSRARETAQIVGRALGLPLRYADPTFRERAYGIFEGLTREECIHRFPAEWARFQADPDGPPPPGVEALADVTARMLTGLRRVAALQREPNSPEGAWLVVAHGRAIRCLVGAITPEPTAPLANGGAYRIDLEDGEPVRAALLDA